MLKDIKIRKLEKQDEIPYDLLLLADPSKKNIDKYIIEADIYTIEKEKQTIACYALCKVDSETVEIKNIAVASHEQGKGIGACLLQHAIDQAKVNRFKRIIIGTGNSSTAQLHLYEKVGFSIYSILKDFFIMNYDEAIFENGIACTDMIMLEKKL